MADVRPRPLGLHLSPAARLPAAVSSPSPEIWLCPDPSGHPPYQARPWNSLPQPTPTLRSFPGSWLSLHWQNSICSWCRLCTSCPHLVSGAGDTQRLDGEQVLAPDLTQGRPYPFSGPQFPHLHCYKVKRQTDQVKELFLHSAHTLL